MRNLGILRVIYKMIRDKIVRKTKNEKKLVVFAILFSSMLEIHSVQADYLSDIPSLDLKENLATSFQNNDANTVSETAIKELKELDLKLKSINLEYKARKQSLIDALSPEAKEVIKNYQQEKIKTQKNIK